MRLSTKGTWIFLFLISLCAVAVIVVPIVTHSIHNAWYGVVAVLFTTGIYNLYFGVKKLHTAHQNSKPAVWYKETSIDLGIMSLLLALLEMIMYGIADSLSATIGDNVAYVAIGILGVAIITFFILFLRYRSKNGIAASSK